MRILAIVAVIGCVIGVSGCAAPAAGAGPKANVSLAGRWSGSFMARQGGEGGSARLVIDADGRVRGSLRDAAMQPGAVGTPRMATLDGRVNGGQMKLQVSWVGGAAAGFSGDCSNQALGSLGVNLLPDSGPASGMIVLSLHEQGVSGKPPFGGEIMSHDFVEAAFLRRAGWEVWMTTDLGGSFEEPPPTLLDHLIRDRRWCQGNLQHLRIVFAQGLTEFGVGRVDAHVELTVGGQVVGAGPKRARKRLNLRLSQKWRAGS
jgi:hypothetical protein